MRTLRMLAAIGLFSIWFTSLPQAETYLPTDSKGVLLEYSVNRPVDGDGGKGELVKFIFNHEAQKGLKRTVDSLPRPR